MDIGMLILRLVVGGLMFGHGTQKLFGWFGGGGVGGTKGFFGSLGYPAAGTLAVVAGMAEAGGGLLLGTGFLTPLGAAAITGVLFNAIVTAHWPKVWNTEGGLEFPLAMATAAIAVAFAGPGRFSLDALAGWSLAGSTWGLVALGIGVGVGLIPLTLRALTRRTKAGANAEDERLAA
ncbi:MAG: DoxX family protein [Actinomycetota bacterium]